MADYYTSGSETAFPYADLAKALTETDDQARDSMYGPQAGLAANLRAEQGRNWDKYVAEQPAREKASTDMLVHALISQVPVAGDVQAAGDTYDSLKDHDWLGAGLNALGAVPLVGGMIAGPLARTANLTKLGRASEMASAGHAPEDIWDATGWFKGADDKWRFEIPDDKLGLRRVTQDKKATMAQWNPATGGQTIVPVDNQYKFSAFAHPELKKSYDFPEKIAGGYGPVSSGGGLYISPPEDPQTVASFAKNGYIDASGRNEYGARSTLAHELQHAVQNREGFAMGGNPSMWTPEQVKAAQEANLDNMRKQASGTWRQVNLDLPPDAPGNMVREPWVPPQPAEYYLSEQDARDNLYKRLAGEVEARNTSLRLGLSPQERMQTPPWETMDVPLDNQIVFMPGQDRKSINVALTPQQQLAAALLKTNP